jgi:hypothetical protein
MPSPHRIFTHEVPIIRCRRSTMPPLLFWFVVLWFCWCGWVLVDGKISLCQVYDALLSPGQPLCQVDAFGIPYNIRCIQKHLWRGDADHTGSGDVGGERASHHGEGGEKDSVGGVYPLLLLSLLVLPFLGVHTTRTALSSLGPALHPPPSFLFPLGPLPLPLSLLTRGSAGGGDSGCRGSGEIRWALRCPPPPQRLPGRGAQ